MAWLGLVGRPCFPRGLRRAWWQGLEYLAFETRKLAYKKCQIVLRQGENAHLGARRYGGLERLGVQQSSGAIVVARPQRHGWAGGTTFDSSSPGNNKEHLLGNRAAPRQNAMLM